MRAYFDNNATTPIAPEALAAYSRAAVEAFGNASSIHQDGQAAKHRLETAREQVAALLNATAKEIVFVSGGTEANNLAIFGVARLQRGAHIITSSIEHPAVLNACAQLEEEGCDITQLPPGASGAVDPADVARALRPNTKLISLMHVNNEIGTLQPIEAVAQIARSHGAMLHSDGVQAAGRVPVDVRELGVDLYSVSAHKMYAPKGIGALFVRKGVALAPMLFGGRHEQQRRAGTENVPGAAAFGAAAAHALTRLSDDIRHITELRGRFEHAIEERIPQISVNGRPSNRAPNTSNISFPGIGGEAMVIALDLQGFAVSSGSACSSGSVEPSHVLLAMGQSNNRARSSVRFSFGRYNTTQEVDALIEAVVAAAAHLRRISPVYAHA